MEEAEDRCRSAEIVIVNKFPINELTLRFMPLVKYIVVSATGYNNIDLDAVKKRNIPVSNVRDYSTESVAQHVFAAVFAILNKAEYYNKSVKSGVWAKKEDFCFYDHTITELSGKTIGIMGFGNIGSRVGDIAHAFGMKVLATTRNISKNKPDFVSFVTVENLLTHSDIVSLHIPLSIETESIINELTLNMMKANAILINTARGALVDENALLNALENGTIGGAALDVLRVEPPDASHPLIHHPRCLVTPHIAWASMESRQILLNGIKENILHFKQGNIINPIYT